MTCQHRRSDERLENDHVIERKNARWLANEVHNWCGQSNLPISKLSSTHFPTSFLPFEHIQVDCLRRFPFPLANPRRSCSRGLVLGEKRKLCTCSHTVHKIPPNHCRVVTNKVGYKMALYSCWKEIWLLTRPYWWRLPDVRIGDP